MSPDRWSIAGVFLVLFLLISASSCGGQECHGQWGLIRVNLFGIDYAATQGAKLSGLVEVSGMSYPYSVPLVYCGQTTSCAFIAVATGYSIDLANAAEATVTGSAPDGTVLVNRAVVRLTPPVFMPSDGSTDLCESDGVVEF